MSANNNNNVNIMDLIERLARVEERVAVTMEKLAEFVSDYSDKVNTALEKVVLVETLMQTSRMKSLDAMHSKINILWESRRSAWKILTPVLSSGLGGAIVWLLTKLTQIQSPHP